MIALMRAGYRLAVRQYERDDFGGGACHSCLLYAPNLTARPPYQRLRWRLVERLLKIGAIERVRTIGGDETYYRLASDWRESNGNQGDGDG